MYIAEKTGTIFFNSPIITILGMQIATFIIVMCLVVVVAGLLIYYFWKHKKTQEHKQEAKGNVLLEFVDTFGGPVQRVLCEEYKGEAKKIEDQSRGMFTVNAMAKVKDMPISDRIGHSIDSYFLLPEHDYLDEWPYDVPEDERQVVKKFYFTKNCPWPNMPHDRSRWDQERYMKITANIAKNARNEVGLEYLVTAMTAPLRELIDRIKGLKHIPLILILNFVKIFMLLIIGYLLINQGNSLSVILKWAQGVVPK